MMRAGLLLKAALLCCSSLSVAPKWCFCSAFVSPPMIPPSKQQHQSTFTNLEKHDCRRRSRRRRGNRIIVGSSTHSNSSNNNSGTPDRQQQPQQQQHHHHHSTSNLSRLQDSIAKMTHFFASMVDIGEYNMYRFYYRCLPQTGERIHKVHPIRDLAAVWDATKILAYFWNEHNDNHHFMAYTNDDSHYQQDLAVLQQAVCHTLKRYHQTPLSLKSSCHYDGAMILNPQILQETSTIAHSALFLLAYTGANRHCRDIGPLSNNAGHDILNVNVDGLTRAILSMQQVNGAFQTEFGEHHDDIYRNIDFFPGEAMLALMEIYHHQPLLLLDPTTRNAIMPSMERALDFYANYYQENNPDTNYNIWQIQAFARFFRHVVSAAKEDTTVNNNNNNNSDRTTSAQKAADYVLRMCHDIINSKSWKYQLARGRPFYPNLSTVEIACGLDALVDGIQVAEAITVTSGSHDSEAALHHHHQQQDIIIMLRLFWRNADNAVDFLQWSLDQAPTEPTEIGYGGLGYGGTQILKQRLDVSGHTVSAFLKLHGLLLARSHDNSTNNT